MGYYKNEEATTETFIGDWLKTGDLAKVDEDGYIWIVDRKKDLIISGGVNIYPKEVEEVLVTHPAIHEVAVVGVPHPEWGETVKAYFAASEVAGPGRSETICERKLAQYKVPRLYEQVEALPRNASGKILKQPLRERDKMVLQQRSESKTPLNFYEARRDTTNNFKRILISRILRLCT